MAVLAIAWDLEALTQIGYITPVVNTGTTVRNSSYSAVGVSTMSNSTNTVFSATGREQELVFSSAVGSFWFHATYSQIAFTATDAGEVLRFKSASGGELRLRGNGSGGTALECMMRFEKTTNGTTWTQIGSSFLLRSGVVLNLDLKVILHASTGEVRLFANGVQVFSFTGDTSTQTNTANGVYLGNSTTGAASSDIVWSELVVADEPTFDWHVATLNPTAAGTHTQWTGAFSDIDDAGVNYADLITTNVVNNQSSFQITDTVSTQTNNNIIKALAVASRSSITPDATPADLQHIVRSGGTTYATANLAVPKDGNYHSRSTLYATDPATSAAWTPAGVNALEIGVKAV